MSENWAILIFNICIFVVVEVSIVFVSTYRLHVTLNKVYQKFRPHPRLGVTKFEIFFDISSNQLVIISIYKSIKIDYKTNWRTGNNKLNKRDH
jgi:hypothetical protein